jgi:hypothetical protein
MKPYVVLRLKNLHASEWVKQYNQIGRWCQEKNITYIAPKPCWFADGFDPCGGIMHWDIPDEFERTMFLLAWGGDVIAFPE